MIIRSFETPQEVARATADLFVEKAQKAVEARGRFSVCLSGGNTAKAIHDHLVNRTDIPWEHTYVFWGDERTVPRDHPDSNVGAGFSTLLDKVPVPADHIFAIDGGLEPQEAARTYELALAEYFEGRPPVFDLVLLGIGEDGHTASLFPGTHAIREEERWVVAPYIPSKDMYRITLTAPLINQARLVVIAGYGENKAKAIYEVLLGKHQPDQYPAQLIRPDGGKLYWLLDSAAASALPAGFAQTA
ncbi:6-phosphogluconolactonase [Catalinimonas alkaloidigena]|uniref:6-phosphogluconolactonase n=1 Tax=Catalinimonas alkaloidigena TaxID=1075417 RepID=A0A1G9LPE6_9BACT|nr:6-phosphogluconolactonase [Catalinimonas alkaloidigena]SDL63365.1 6-phosphogluconolactonase [Catalinimonas alkaloidigena]